MALLDAADWLGLGLGLGLVNNNLKVKLLKVGLASSWPGIESAASKRTRPLKQMLRMSFYNINRLKLVFQKVQFYCFVHMKLQL